MFTELIHTEERYTDVGAVSPEEAYTQRRE